MLNSNSVFRIFLQDCLQHFGHSPFLGNRNRLTYYSFSLTSVWHFCDFLGAKKPLALAGKREDTHIVQNGRMAPSNNAGGLVWWEPVSSPLSRWQGSSLSLNAPANWTAEGVTPAYECLHLPGWIDERCCCTVCSCDKRVTGVSSWPHSHGPRQSVVVRCN